MRIIHERTETRGTDVPAPSVRVADLASELKALRKGRALQSSLVVKRIGPTLRLVCSIAVNDPPAETLHKVSDWLRDQIALLPSDLRISVLAAFGLHHDVQLRLYQDRVTWVAHQLNRDPRTARRRIDDAIDRLAEMTVTGEIDTVNLLELIDRPVELTFTMCGVTEHDEMTCQCRIVAVAQAVDGRCRFLAVVEMLDDTTMIAIPTTRIRRAAPIDGSFADKLWRRTDDRGPRREFAATSG